jgi:hypothetical protein
VLAGLARGEDVYAPVTALNLACLPGSEPHGYEGLRERDLPEVTFHSRVEHRNSQYALVGPLNGDRAGTDRAAPCRSPIAPRSASGEHRRMARYHVTVVSGDPSRTAAEVAAAAGAEVIRKMSVTDGVAALATDEQIDALTAAGATVHRHADLAEGRAERLAEVGEGDRYAEALRRLAGR